MINYREVIFAIFSAKYGVQDITLNHLKLKVKDTY